MDRDAARVDADGNLGGLEGRVVRHVEHADRVPVGIHVDEDVVVTGQRNGARLPRPARSNGNRVGGRHQPENRPREGQRLYRAEPVSTHWETPSPYSVATSLL